MNHPLIGKMIQEYKVTKLLGVGGMGNVYLGVHQKLGRKVAIKMLHARLAQNEGLRERFRNEASTLAHLQHQNIVALYDYVENDEGLFLIMEYVEGHGLDEYINTVSGPIPEEKSVEIFGQILDGFQYAHDQGVIHRDIKPSNILISKKGVPKIMDFGIAKILTADKSLTKTGMQMGTVLYMSPEQVKGEKVDHQSDIYSLGITLFQMVTGQCPYSAESTEFEVYSQIVNQPLPSARELYPGISAQVEAAIKRATAKEGSNRFTNCSEFKAALDLSKPVTPPPFSQNTAPVPQRPSTRPVPPPIRDTATKKPVEARKKKRWPLVVGFLLIVITGVVFAFIYGPGGNNLLSSEDDAEPIPSKPKAVLFANLALRAEPMLSAEQLGSYSCGDEVDLVATPTQREDGTWCQVKVDGITGYMKMATKGNPLLIEPSDNAQFLRVLQSNTNHDFYDEPSYVKATVFERLFGRQIKQADNIASNDNELGSGTTRHYLQYSPDGSEISDFARVRSRYLNSEYKDQYKPDYFVILRTETKGEMLLLDCRFNNDTQAGYVDQEYNLTAGQFNHIELIGLERIFRKNTVYWEGGGSRKLPYDGVRFYFNDCYNGSDRVVFFRYEGDDDLKYGEEKSDRCNY